MLIHITKSLMPYLKEQLLSSSVNAETIKQRSAKPEQWGWHAHRFPYGDSCCVLVCHDETGYILTMPGLEDFDYQYFTDLIREYLIGSLEEIGYTPAQSKQVVLCTGPTMIDDQTHNDVKEMLSVAWQDIQSFLEDRPNLFMWNPVRLNALINQRIIKKDGEWCRPDDLFSQIIEEQLSNMP